MHFLKYEKSTVCAMPLILRAWSLHLFLSRFTAFSQIAGSKQLLFWVWGRNHAAEVLLVNTNSSSCCGLIEFALKIGTRKKIKV
jgi:hypothetical protein